MSKNVLLDVFIFRQCKDKEDFWGNNELQSSVTTYTTLCYNLCIVTLQLALQEIKKG